MLKYSGRLTIQLQAFAKLISEDVLKYDTCLLGQVRIEGIK